MRDDTYIEFEYWSNFLLGLTRDFLGLCALVIVIIALLAKENVKCKQEQSHGGVATIVQFFHHIHKKYSNAKRVLLFCYKILRKQQHTYLVVVIGVISSNLNLIM